MLQGGCFCGVVYKYDNISCAVGTGFGGPYIMCAEANYDTLHYMYITLAFLEFWAHGNLALQMSHMVSFHMYLT